MPKRNTVVNQWLTTIAFAACTGCAARDASPPPPAPVAASPSAPDASPALGDGLGSDVRAWTAAQRRGVQFRAVGNEPGWVLEVDSMRGLRLVTRYGTDSLLASDPMHSGVSDTLLFAADTEGHAVRVSAIKTPCEDPMSGEQHPYTVRVSVDDNSYEGCGRAL